MPLTPEDLRLRFAGGASAQEYKASLPDGGARLTELESLVEAGGPASPFAQASQELNVLAIVEGWCRDSRDAAAVLLHLVDGRPNVTLRFLLRDENPDLMAAYRKDGQFDSIPVLVFLDSNFTEIGRYVERPDEVTAMYQRHRAEVAERQPEFPADVPLPSFDKPVRKQLRAALDELRERDRPEANRLIAAALESIAARAVDESPIPADRPRNRV